MEKQEKLWSKKDKMKLLFLLQQYGSLNLEILHEKMPHKSVKEIQELCNYYISLSEQEDGKKKKKDVPPMQAWTGILRNVTNEPDEPVKYLISRILKYIAWFEKRNNSSNVNLTKCYLFLSDMCQELNVRKLTKGNDYFLKQCLKQLAEEVKAPGSGGLRKFLKTMEMIEKTEDTSMFYRVLNPLYVPDDIVQLAKLKSEYNMFD